MRPRPATVAATVVATAAAVVLSGCTGSSGQPSASSAAPSTGAVSLAPMGTPVPRSQVAADLERGLLKFRTTHLAVSTALSGQTVTGHGDVVLSAGSITRGDVTEQLPSGLGSIRVIINGTRTYAKLPTALSNSSKPWVLLSPSSSHVVVSQLASTLVPILAVASPSTLVKLLNAATTVSDLGPAQAGGVSATHYRFVANSSKLPNGLLHSLAGSAAELPVDLYLDKLGRPVQMSGTFGIAGQQAKPTIVLTEFNEPVTATPPPATEIDSS